MKTASIRLYEYLLHKLDEEPVSKRAALCDDLAEFSPNDAMARKLRSQAELLRQIERDASVMRLALKPDIAEPNPLPAAS